MDDVYPAGQHPSSYPRMSARIGSFLFLLGFILVIFFVLTDLANQPNFLYFILGAFAVIAGAFLWWRIPGGAPPPPSGRFRLLKNLSTRGKQPPKKK
jgi:hypothetical protein